MSKIGTREETNKSGQNESRERGRGMGFGGGQERQRNLSAQGGYLRGEKKRTAAHFKRIRPSKLVVGRGMFVRNGGEKEKLDGVGHRSHLRGGHLEEEEV